MPLTSQTAAVLEAMRAAGVKSVDTLAPAQARDQMSTLARARRTVVTPVARVEDRLVAAGGRTVKTRLYYPETRGPLPAVIYLHGGGHVIGDVDTHDEVARVFCAGSEALVVSVDYRKAPEHKFPAAVEDVYAAIDWLHASARGLGVDPQRIALAGDSAGANLAAVGAFHVRDRGLPQLAQQVLIYPITDYAMGTDSYRRYADGYGIVSLKAMTWFRDHYLATPADANDWRASPIKAASLAGLAPATVITAEYDVLHDEGIAYANALRAAGVDVLLKDYPGLIHGFFVMAPAIDEARDAQNVVIDRLKACFATR